MKYGYRLQLRVNMENIMLSERSQSQNACLHRDRKQTGSCREPEGERMGRACLMRTGFAFGIKRFGTRKRCSLHNFVNVLSAVELYTFK